MPILLRRIRQANPDIDITILLATGFHRPTTKEEMIDKFGKDIAENEHIVCHISSDMSQMKKIGVLPSGGDCIINKLAADAELLIAEGFIEPHFLQASPVAARVSFLVLLLKSPLWLTTAVNSSLTRMPVLAF